jgi:hypothetical protein
MNNVCLPDNSARLYFMFVRSTLDSIMRGYRIGIALYGKRTSIFNTANSIRLFILAISMTSKFKEDKRS